MGMFDKDKVFAPDGPMDKWVDDGVEFIVWDCRVVDEAFDVGDGNTATMVHWDVSALDAPDNVATVSTIGSAMAEKAKAKGDDDLPAVVKTKHVETDYPSAAYVMQFERAYEAPKAKAGK